eukprot:scaffold287423_cov22-Tisochrysis_lutea.AAC.1
MVDGGSPVSFLNCANSPIILTDLKALAWRAEGVDDVRVCVSGLWGVCVSIRGPGEIACLAGICSERGVGLCWDKSYQIINSACDWHLLLDYELVRLLGGNSTGEASGLGAAICRDTPSLSRSDAQSITGANAEQGCGGGTTCVEGVLFGWEPE